MHEATATDRLRAVIRTEPTWSTSVALLDPASRRPLVRDSAHSLSDGSSRWPLVDGVAYLRCGRDDLRHGSLAALDAGDERGALALLLTDQDPFAPLPAPSTAMTRAVVDAVCNETISLRDAMQALNFGPVTDYFAHRTCTPTYLSGLALLAHGGRPRAVLELACGIGQFLRELEAHGVPALGVDLVFAKLWLARRFVAPHAQLVCADAVCPPLAPARSLTVMCHDAFYFFDQKAEAAQQWMRLAADDGRVLVGHAHSAHVEQPVAGSPLTPSGYAALLPGCALYDDAELTASALSRKRAPVRSVDHLNTAEAVSLVWPGARRSWWPDILQVPAATPLRLNPLLGNCVGRTVARWPSPRFAAEYAPLAGYLNGPMPAPRVVRRALHGTRGDAEIGELARRRVLVDLPERW